MNKIIVSKIDELYLRLDCSDSISMELNQHFSFYVDGYKYTPRYKAGLWNGKIYIYNHQQRKLYIGLLLDLIKLAKSRSYEVILNDKLTLDVKNEYEEFLETIPDICNYIPRSYQLESVENAVKLNKIILQSATGSGKSFILYLYSRFIMDKLNGKILMIVPTIALTKQMEGDFVAYCKDYDIKEDIHLITAGASKDLWKINKRIVISTFQSLAKQPKEWFDYFSSDGEAAILIDECHTAEAKSLQNIIHNCSNFKFKIGCTGTLRDSKTSEMQMKGLLGIPLKVTTTKQLMDAGVLAKLEIHNLVLNYSLEERELLSHNKDYQKEVKYILSHDKRNQLIVNLAKQETGNTLIIFNLIEHGKLLQSKLEESGKEVHYIAGEVDIDTRDNVRMIAESKTGIVIIASVQTFSAGVNIKNLHTLIFAHPSKSLIRVVQSIGRTLRTHESKKVAKLIDLTDNLATEDKINFLMLHSIERQKIYKEEQFEVKNIQIDLV